MAGIMAEEEDRISALPDHLIHRILSLLPSTKQAVRTATLSKGWRHQWTAVSVLIFHSKRRDDRFVDFIDKTLALHDCSKINTFHLKSLVFVPNFDEHIRFAATRQVEDLNLRRPVCGGVCSLPQFLFSCTSLVKLTTTYFVYDPTGEAHWVRLKALNLDSCRFSDQAMEFILSGSPLLESLELKLCSSAVSRDRLKFKNLALTSKSLKKLVLAHTRADILQISCPNLKELCIKEFSTRNPTLFEQAIQKVLSNSLLLESFMLLDCNCRLHRPVIASQSLKRLVMGNLSSRNSLEISCPELEELEISGYMDMMDVKFRDVPSSLCATLDIHIRNLSITKFNRSCKDTLQQLQHIKELRVGSFILQLLRGCVEKGLPFPMLHVKCLILHQPVLVVPLSSIAYVLRHLPILETLVCNLAVGRPLYDAVDDMAKLDGYGESNSSLKTVKIYGLAMEVSEPKCMLNLVRFLLNKARVLQRMTVVLTKCDRKDISFSISRALFRFPRCSENAIVELISQCS